MSCEGGSRRRLSEIQTKEAVQDMRDNVCAKPHTEAQYMQSRMSVRNWSPERDEKMAWGEEPDIPRVTTGIKNRTNRLRALGNAVVPHIPYIIGKAIMEAEKCES
jgi:hypothetical protein